MTVTKIGWSQFVWNPLWGCNRVGAGCDNCYAIRMARRHHNSPIRGGLTKQTPHGLDWTGEVRLIESKLIEPMGRKTPTTYFVDSMSDLFHHKVPDVWVDRIFAVMALCPQHRFQILTKRPERMQDYIASTDAQLRILDRIKDHRPASYHGVWPLPNVNIGFSAWDDKSFLDGAGHVLATPAATRFVSLEPLLGPVTMDRHHWTATFAHWFDWVIAGGEKGNGARPMHPDWVRSLRDQCSAADTPFFFKQWGEWLDWETACDVVDAHLSPDDFKPHHQHKFDDGTLMLRVGSKLTGATLDGQLHTAMPGENG